MRLRSVWATFGALLSAAATVLVAGGRVPQTTELKVGDMAPAFELRGSDGKVHRLADYRGQAVVLAWFPKAFTGG